jgi:cell wall-associated NlpC family hydrolase
MKTITFLLSLLLLPSLAFAENGVQLTLSSSLSLPSFPVADTPYNFALPEIEPMFSAQEESDSLNRLITYAEQLKHTPYRRSGISKATGFDCSGFVSYVFNQTLGIKLPHRASDIWTEGQKIDLANLEPGDLVFYNTMRRKLSHVGIYIGNGQFIHSASRGGVRIDSIHTAYWQPRWNGARRIAALKS